LKVDLLQAPLRGRNLAEKHEVTKLFFSCIDFQPDIPQIMPPPNFNPNFYPYGAQINPNANKNDLQLLWEDLSRGVNQLGMQIQQNLSNLLKLPNTDFVIRK